jgi:hypothetical protein
VVTELQPNPSVMACGSFSVTLHVADDGTATLGKDGFMDVTSAELTNGSYVLGGFYVACGNQTTIAGLTLHGNDNDGDGVADTVSGTATGTAFSGGGDVVLSEPIQIAFTGVPDVTAPQLVPLTDAVSPIVGFKISASEPLDSTTSLMLAGTTHEALSALPAIDSQGIATTNAIQWSSDTLLPLAGQWQIQGTGQDLIGHALVTSGTLKTLADPGIFAQDGFEGTLVAAIENGSPSIVTGRGSVTAISGGHSLWLSPGDAVTFHLKRVAAETSLRFSARAFAQYGQPYVSADVRAGVVGSAAQFANGTTPTASTIDTGDATWKEASEAIQLTVPLSGAGADVLLRISPNTCNGFCPLPSAMMVDDLTLE